MNDFLLTVRAEWTKLRTVRGWVLALVVALVVPVVIGLTSVNGSRSGGCPGAEVCGPPTGPGGEAVTDAFTFVHRSLGPHGSLTARITGLTGQRPRIPGSGGGGAPVPQAWAKAGVMVKEDTEQGAAYAAVMVTGGHGVRMQSDFTHDTAAPKAGTSSTAASSAGAHSDAASAAAPPTAAAPRWLRLTRAGSTLTGATSPDGTHWTTIGTATLPGLPATAQAGLFTTSPEHTEVDRHALGESATSGPTRATATFDRVTLSGAATANSTESGGLWRTTVIGADPVTAAFSASSQRSTPAGESFTVSGSGDIAPAVGGRAFGARSVEDGLVGTFAGLLVLVVVGSSFVTAEYRRGLIRGTLAAQPRRGRLLAAKALVVAAAAFAVGLVAAALSLKLTASRLHAKGVYVLPAATGAEVRVVVGTALLLALAAVLALGAGILLRRGAGAVTAVAAAVVLPYILAISGALPVAGADWVLRVTPAAAFAVQQTTVRYSQVAGVYAPSDGYFPLAPWAGMAVLCGWTVLVVGAAYAVLRRRDA
ncbi:ABC-type transport system involved in multi-copper enzyme maturation, permease component [Actinacidiphila yanglinensis]|uniref:ABC-type transport system involved in multi-copper enzyme maturation, permease component n=1 Tax=Actinacidiphila yanglinensis TaxID=310779 RepID=A0A1H5VNJ3_9ACTN|nr:ABC transporter permease subunit [Actinacidiphila yanglinensis]SEF88458.1 ABC-type transport system involved in multi-copper enzyme maturation, permease component [Actinacidiphila yanglinensis]